MVKLYIDPNGLSPLVQALTGQARDAGVQAGLRNRIAEAQLDKARMDNQAQMLQQERRDSMLAAEVRKLFPNMGTREQENILYQAGGNVPQRGFMRGSDGLPVMGADGVPMPDNDYGISQDVRNSPAFSQLADTVSKLNMANTYGKDSEDIARAFGQLDRNRYDGTLRSGIAQALAAGNQDAANRYTSALAGKAYEPYQLAGNGMMYNQATGMYHDTPLSMSNINQNNAAAYANQQRGNLYDTQRGTEQAQRLSYLAQADERGANADRLRQMMAGEINKNGVMLGQDGSLQRLPASQRPLPAPNTDVARLFTRNVGVDPITNKPIDTPDYEYMNRVQAFALQNGIGDWVQAKYMFDQAGLPRDAKSEAANKVMADSVGLARAVREASLNQAANRRSATGGKASPESIIGIRSGMGKQQIFDAIQRANQDGTLDKQELRRLAERYLK